MNTGTAPKPEGLRARKRRATENAIESAAVRLALKHGVENVTVEAICELADISRSTFFNYFSARDYAIVGRASEFPEGPDTFAVLDASPDNLPLGIFRLLFAGIGHWHVNAEVARMRNQLVYEQPEARRLMISTRLETSFNLSELTTKWLLANPQHGKLNSPLREATMAVTIVHGAVTAQMQVWADSVGDTDADEADFIVALNDIAKLLK